MKIYFDIIDTSRQKITKARTGYIELLDHYAKLVLDFECDETDEDEKITKPKRYFNNRIMDRFSIGEITLFLVASTGNWCVEIDSPGMLEAVNIQFNQYDKAKDLFNKIVQWRYPQNENINS